MSSRRECANAIRALSIDAIEKAASGHPGAPLGMADMAEALWGHFLSHNPNDPHWANRDRFILSNGHASMLLYSLLHLTGYDLPMEEIKNFRQYDSATPGHPERNPARGIEMTTGPLGEGIASAVGLALAEAMLAAAFNRPDFTIIDHYTYVFCGEGCLMEGVTYEACSLAGTWKLGKLIVMFDANGVSIDGNVQQWFTEDVGLRFKSCGWQVIGPVDGHDSEALDKALAKAREDKERPSIIICKTHIGFGSPKSDSSASHGAPLGKEAAMATKANLNWNYPPFMVPEVIYQAWDAREKGAEAQRKWQTLMDAYARTYPELAKELEQRLTEDMPRNWQEIREKLLRQDFPDSMATRVASQKCLNILVADIPEMLGGSADLSGSVGAVTPDSVPFNPVTHKGNYLYYGVREFAMGAIMNGLALHGGFIPYAGTFLSFTDQARNALRLAALMGLRVIWVMTHDSIGVGEDGPTHQPIEHISSLRLIPGMEVWRPCDYMETAWAWINAIENVSRPTSLILSRQKVPPMSRSKDKVAEISRGGYVLWEANGGDKLIILASGSEVGISLEAGRILADKGIGVRVVSMPCNEVFDRQPIEWRDKVLPPVIRCRIAVEAASSDWWYKYVGLDGKIIGMTTFGKSAPGAELFRKFGFTPENIVMIAEKMLSENNQ